MAVRSMLVDLLWSRGHTVLEARNGREALAIAREYPASINVLLSDIQMPEMSGPELARALLKEQPEVAIVFVSAQPSGTLLLDDGWYYIQKPFVPKELIQKIEKIISGPPSPLPQEP